MGAENVVNITLRLQGSQVTVQGIGSVTRALQGSAGAATNAGAATTGLSQATATATAAHQQQGITLTQLTQRAAAYAGAIGLATQAHKALTAQDGYAGLLARLTRLEGSATGGAEAMQRVTSIAQRQGVELDAVGSAYTRVGASVQRLGGDSQATGRIVETVAASLRLNNATASESASVMLQFGQAMAKGKVNGDEFSSMMENAPVLMDAVAAALGKNKGELYAMAEAGQLTSATFGRGVLASFESITAAAAQMPATVSQATQRMGNAFTQAAGESATAAGASKVAIAGLSVVTEHAGEVFELASAGAAGMSAVLGGRLVASIASAMVAMQASRSELVQELATKAQAAEADVRRASTALASARTQVLATETVTLAQQNLTRATQVATAAQNELAVAQSATRTGLAGVLGVFGGPVGLIASLALAAAGWWAYKAASSGGDETDALLNQLEAQAKALRLTTQAGQEAARAKALAAAAPEAGFDPNSGAYVMDDSKAQAVEAKWARIKELQKEVAAGAPAAPTVPTLTDPARSLASLRQELGGRTKVLQDYRDKVQEINAAAEADSRKAATAAGTSEAQRTAALAKVASERTELLQIEADKRDQGLAALDQRASQTAAARAAQTLQGQRNESDAKLRAMDAELTQLERRRDADLVSLAEYADQKAAIEQRMLAERLAMNAKESAAKASEKPVGAAAKAQQLTELSKLAGEAAKLRDDARAQAGAGVQAYYDASAQSYERAAGDLRQAGLTAQQQIVSADDANASAAIALIADPVAQATAAAALSVTQARRQTEEEIKALQASIGRFKAERYDLIDPDAVPRAQAQIEKLRASLSTRESLIGKGLDEQLKPQWQRTLEGWRDTTTLMRGAWDSAITTMVDGASDAFGRFVSGQQVNLKSLGQSLVYTIGKTEFQRVVGNASSGGGLVDVLRGLSGRSTPALTTKGVSGVESDAGFVVSLQDSASALGTAASDSATALTDAAASFDSPVGGLLSAGEGLAQSALGWLMPQSAQTTAGVSLTTAGAELGAAAMALNSAAASLGVSGGGGSTGWLSTAMEVVAAANGGVYGGQSVRAFATGGAFARGGEVLTGPTAFRLLEGAQVRQGIAGEDGPEAAVPLKEAGGTLGMVVHGARGRKVLPLTRGADGVLGVADATLQAVANGGAVRGGGPLSARPQRGRIAAFAAGGVFGSVASKLAAGATVAGESVGKGMARGAAQSGGSGAAMSISLPTTIHVDARSDQAQVAQLVSVAMAQTEKRLWRQMRERGVA